jgi:hypothetical protein
MKYIGIIGSGIVGKTLASGFIKHGYAVMIGTRSKAKHAELINEFNNKIKAGNFSETAAFAEIIVLAVPGLSAKEAIELCGVENICGKTVIDATNPIDQKPPENGVLRFFTNLDESLMEQMQKAFPEVRFVKAFNSVGNAFMVNPDFGGTQPSMFICGNNTDAKKDVTEILTTFGWETEDMGGAEAARAIEPLCMLWCIPGLRENKWTHAFKLLKK